MSTLESFIWHLLGYSAIPVILITGIFISSLLFFVITEFLGSRGDE